MRTSALMFRRLTGLALLLACIAHVVSAEDGGDKSGLKNAESPKAVPGELTQWRLSLDLGSDGPERRKVGWHEIEIASDGKCTVTFRRRKGKEVLFDGKLPPDDVKAVLRHTRDAINNGPPMRKGPYWHDGMRIDVRLTAPRKSFETRRDGLHAEWPRDVPTAEGTDAGPEVQNLIKLILAHVDRAQRG